MEEGKEGVAKAKVKDVTSEVCNGGAMTDVGVREERTDMAEVEIVGSMGRD